ncbi:hypothetical protein NQZ68_000280 [Dissostichus eleginoides]|nr:hypothetical protein NQZ68_000280 [Dissostichus eleginoides]
MSDDDVYRSHLSLPVPSEDLCGGYTGVHIVRAAQGRKAACGMESSYWLLLACIKSRSGKFNQINCEHTPRARHQEARSNWDDFCFVLLLVFHIFCNKDWLHINTMKERRNTQPLVVRCKLVLVGDVQCGKTAMLQVLAKDCYPETYVPTVFENYTACLELEEQRVELSLWDTSVVLLWPHHIERVSSLSRLSFIDRTDLIPSSTWQAAPSPSPAMDLQTKINLPVLISLVQSDMCRGGRKKGKQTTSSGLYFKMSEMSFDSVKLQRVFSSDSDRLWHVKPRNNCLTPGCKDRSYQTAAAAPQLPVSRAWVGGQGYSHPQICSPYYDNVRPLCYSDSDAVLLCFDISRPDTVDGSLKKWKTEILDFCPSTRILLIGCKTDLRTDVCTLMELSNQKQTPITYEQGSAMAKQLGAEAYLECSAFTSEKSIHSVFRTAAMACINKLQPLPKSSPTRRLSKRLLHLPSKSDLISSTFKKEKAKSCSVM